MQPYELNHKYRLVHDERQFILEERWRGKSKDGEAKEGWRQLGFYSHLPNAMWAFVNRQVGKSPDSLPEALRKAVVDAQRVVSELSSAIHGACGGAL